MDRGARGDDRQRQRQPGAAADDLFGGDRLGGESIAADPGGQQALRLLRRQQAEGERMRAVRQHQPREMVPAGDHHQAAGRSGQQRGDLVGVAGVVQQHQHAPPGQQAAVESGPRGLAVRDPVRRHLQRAEELQDGRLRPYGLGRRVVSAQVDVELTVRKTIGDPVCPAHGERGLPDSGRAGRSP
ncbi:hypothetical protein LUX33_28430 [Actinomadura madurae]|nr:hypothetical protein [Actinomadura madurae]MCP9951978.1 hypothetical protein [Actinomadura madurae]